jgi:hypothetical protein
MPPLVLKSFAAAKLLDISIISASVNYAVDGSGSAVAV